MSLESFKPFHLDPEITNYLLFGGVVYIILSCIGIVVHLFVRDDNFDLNFKNNEKEAEELYTYNGFAFPESYYCTDKKKEKEKDNGEKQ